VPPVVAALIAGVVALAADPGAGLDRSIAWDIVTPIVYSPRFTVRALAELVIPLTITVIGMLSGTGLEPSNYLPFAAGANVVFNNFPANPTTWYLGTYIHALLLWALVFSRRPAGPALIGVALLIEIPARIAIQQTAGPYVAYMMLTNWLTVFVAGLVIGVLARLIKPGKQSLGLLATLGLGLVGSLIGGLIAQAFGTGSIWELNVVGFVLAVVAAVLLIGVAEQVAGKKTSA